MVNEQVKNFIPHLKAGSTYLFEHTRKGPFVARFVGLVPTHTGDPSDEFFIEVEIFTADGSGQERLANTFTRDEMGRKVRPEYEARRLRPALIASISTPSTAQQDLLRQRFEQANKRALGRQVDSSVLPYPTNSAFDLLEAGPEPAQAKPGFFKRLFGKKE